MIRSYERCLECSFFGILRLKRSYRKHKWSRGGETPYCKVRIIKLYHSKLNVFSPLIAVFFCPCNTSFPQFKTPARTGCNTTAWAALECLELNVGQLSFPHCFATNLMLAFFLRITIKMHFDAVVDHAGCWDRKRKREREKPFYLLSMGWWKM